MKLAEILRTYWPDEASMAGNAYVDVIADEVTQGVTDPNQVFGKSEGDHAYGLDAAIDSLFDAAVLVVTCWQLRQSMTNTKELSERKQLEKTILSSLCRALPEDRAKELTETIVSADHNDPE